MDADIYDVQRDERIDILGDNVHSSERFCGAYQDPTLKRENMWAMYFYNP